MKISYNWLLDFLPADYHRSPAELSEILTDTGLEVEGVSQIHSVPGGLEGIVIGEVLTCVKHENADKLNCTTVNLGAETVPIVCGAPNVAAGQKVLVATVGSVVHPTDGDPFEIKKAKIRGEVSQGMICAEDELSLGQSHEGIMVLPADAKVGQKAAEYFNVSSDTQIEIGLTPNRTDAMGHMGVARDIVAALNCRESKSLVLKEVGAKATLAAGNCPVEVIVKDQERCPRYTGAVVQGLTVAASPAWLQNRLTTIGLKPINNVVDITNYICHGFGHPMHAFDLAQVTDNKIEVKTCEQGTTFTTLDEEERKLDERDLMICNTKAPMCIAGVFGGIQSGVSENTKAVFLESAYFNPVSIRKTAKRHGLNTDASFRYERGIDPAAAIDVLNYAVELLAEVAGGKVVGGYADVEGTLARSFQVEFSPKRFFTLAGIKMEEGKMESILSDLDITIESKEDDTWQLTVPGYRADVTRHADICEEILRIYGFNQVPIPEKIALTPGKKTYPSLHQFREMISGLLTARGLSEGLTNGLTKASFGTSSEEISKASIGLLNPLSTDLGILRSHTVFSAVESVLHNSKFNQSKLALYEFAKNYIKHSNGYGETEELCITLAGKSGDESWVVGQQETEWYHLKNLVYLVLERCGIESGIKAKPSKVFWADFGMEIQAKKKALVTWGKVNQKWLKDHEVKQPVYFAHFNVTALYQAFTSKKNIISELPKFPGSRRDLSLLLDQEVAYEALEKEARKSDNQLLEGISLFDVYEGKNLPEGKKSYALSFHFRDPKRTLTDKEVDEIMDNVSSRLCKTFEATLR